MYSFISGKIAEKNPAYIVIDNHGIGYLILKNSTRGNSLGGPVVKAPHFHCRSTASILGRDHATQCSQKPTNRTKSFKQTLMNMGKMPLCLKLKDIQVFH